MYQSFHTALSAFWQSSVNNLRVWLFELEMVLGCLYLIHLNFSSLTIQRDVWRLMSCESRKLFNLVIPLASLMRKF